MLCDVLNIAKQKHYMVLDPVSQEPAEHKPVAMLVAKKKVRSKPERSYKARSSYRDSVRKVPCISAASEQRFIDKDIGGPDRPMLLATLSRLSFYGASLILGKRNMPQCLVIFDKERGHARL